MNLTSFDIKFFNEQDGYGIITSWQKGQQEWRLYPTHDGGKTWQASAKFTIEGDATTSFLNDHQILVVFPDAIAVRTFQNGQWIETWHHQFTSARIMSSSFISAMTSLALVNYTRHEDYVSTAPGDDIRLLKTTDGGKSWTTLQVASPTNKVTPVTMTYLPFTNPQSIQTLHTDVKVKDFWLVALLACTNEKICKPDSF